MSNEGMQKLIAILKEGHAKTIPMLAEEMDTTESDVLRQIEYLEHIGRIRRIFAECSSCNGCSGCAVLNSLIRNCSGETLIWSDYSRVFLGGCEVSGNRFTGMFYAAMYPITVA